MEEQGQERVTQGDETMAEAGRNVPAQRHERTVHRTIPCDVFESDDQYLILGELPGVNKDALTVDMEASVLTLRGERRLGNETMRFERKFTLPDSADPDQVRASIRNGVVRIEIGKTQRSRPRRIEVRA